MNTSPKVSVIIPTYNRPDYVVRAVRSVLGQTYQNFVILVRDDSRDDATEKAIRAIGDSRIRYHKNPVRLDFVENKNTGVKSVDADSPYIAFLDDDDEYLPLFLGKTVEYLEAHSDTFAVTTRAEFKTQSGESLGIYPVEKESWKISMGNSWVFRRGVFFEDNIWFDSSLMSEDLDLGIAIAQKHAWARLPEVLRVYYGYPVVGGLSHTTSFTKKTPPEKITNFLKKNYEFYRKSGPEALSWAYFQMGRMLCGANQAKEGRAFLLRALATKPKISYFLYYISALFFPFLFSNLKAKILKNKIKGIFK